MNAHYNYQRLSTFPKIDKSLFDFFKGIYNLVKNDDVIQNLAKNWKSYHINELLYGYLCGNDDYDVVIELTYRSTSILYDFTFMSGVVFKVRNLSNNMTFYCHIMLSNPKTMDLTNILHILHDIENNCLFGEVLEEVGFNKIIIHGD